MRALSLRAARAAPRRLSTLPAGDGFMARARAAGATALLGLLATSRGRFDACLAGLEVTSVEPARVRAELVVGAHLTNSYGTLHGGAAATLVDVLGTLAALSVDPLRPGVSVDMAQTFLRPARLGERLFLEARCLKSGARLAFTDVELRVGARDGPLAVVGRHTKAL